MAVDRWAAMSATSLACSRVGWARPRQAAVMSAVSFAVGAALPLVLIVLAPIGVRVPVTALTAVGLLALLGPSVRGWVMPRSGGRRCG
jgi:vacuolar iron transporter family protein